MAQQLITLPYLPRTAFLPFHNRKERWACLVVHRRAGKTVSAINELIKSALQCQLPSPRFAYVAPTYSQAKDVAWDYLKRFTYPIPDVKISESELHVTMPGDRRVRLYGADNYDRLRGIYLDGCVVDEPADMDPEAWASIIRPALSDRKGWCVWIGTPKGRDAFYRVWQQGTTSDDWFTMRLPASQSGLLPAEELESAKKQMLTSKGSYDREYECSFETPVQGAVYGDLIADLRQKKRVISFERDMEAPVFATWDVGWNDSMSVWLFQVVGLDIRVIWHTRKQFHTAAQMFEILFATGIPISGHLVPHDAGHKAPGEGKNFIDYMKQAGFLNIITIRRITKIWDGINAARALLPRCWFNVPVCSLGLEAMEAYHTKDTTDGSAIQREPVHDWSSHDASAFRYIAEALQEGLVNTLAARRVVQSPRFPDGSTVDLFTASQRHKRKGRATSAGPSI